MSDVPTRLEELARLRLLLETLRDSPTCMVSEDVIKSMIKCVLLFVNHMEVMIDEEDKREAMLKQFFASGGTTRPGFGGRNKPRKQA